MMYTNKQRVERDGFLIAYEGEVMTEDEAMSRGLIDSAETTEPKRTKANWIAEAEALGLTTTGTISELTARIAAFKAEAEAE